MSASTFDDDAPVFAFQHFGRAGRSLISSLTMRVGYGYCSTWDAGSSVDVEETDEMTIATFDATCARGHVEGFILVR